MAKGRYSAVVLVQVAVRIPLNSTGFDGALTAAKALGFGDAVTVSDGSETIDSRIELQAVEKSDVWIRD